MTANDLYKSVTDSIVAQLEAGSLAPWRCPWNKSGGGLPLRHNGIPYRGVNVFWLWLTATLKGHASPYYMTFQQAREYGGSVRKGEKATPVIFCQPMSKGVTAEDGEEGRENYWIARSYNVFNAQQIDGLPDRFDARPAATLDPSQRIVHAETYVANTGAKIEHAGYAAYYMKLSDKINLPPFESFRSPEAYYATALHELIHWTGAPYRLARFEYEKPTREAYANEEVTTELAATMLCAQLGLEPEVDPDHAAYLDHWLKAMKADARYIFRAASKAQQACDYLNGLQPAI